MDYTHCMSLYSTTHLVQACASNYREGYPKKHSFNCQTILTASMPSKVISSVRNTCCFSAIEPALWKTYSKSISLEVSTSITKIQLKSIWPLAALSRLTAPLRRTVPTAPSKTPVACKMLSPSTGEVGGKAPVM